MKNGCVSNLQLNGFKEQKKIERNNWTCVFLKKGIHVSVYKKQKQQQMNKILLRLFD